MPDEKHYVGTLLELDEALQRLPQMEAHIASTAYWNWQRTIQIEEQQRRAEAEVKEHYHRRASAGESVVDSA
jgi:hypothetical protein